MIEAILWDNDGVLVDTERLYFRATKQVLASVGVDLTKEDYIELILVQGRGAWHLAEEKDVPPTAIERLRDERNALYSRYLHEERVLITGVEETLRALYGKYRMGIVTSSRKDHFDLIHKFTNILRYFDFVLTADDYKRFKPDPEPYLKALARTGCDREECLVVEDSLRGLVSAKAAGIRCIIVPNAMTKGCDFSGAYKVLERVTDIVSALL
jgi:HAD superfamily hydrolase (TIGR01509 family)